MKNKRSIFLLVLTLGLFMLFNVATKKVLDFPCEMQVTRLLQKDTLVPSYYYTTSRDTIVLMAYKDSNWAQKTQQICTLMSDSCNQTGYKILVVDTTSDRTFFNTPYGKKIYWRQCQ